MSSSSDDSETTVGSTNVRSCDDAPSVEVFETICQGYNAEATLALSFSLDSLSEEILLSEKVLVADHMHWYLDVNRLTEDGIEYLTTYVYSIDMHYYPMKYDVTYTLESTDPDYRIRNYASREYEKSNFDYPARCLITCSRLSQTRDKYEDQGKIKVTAKLNVRLPMCCNFSGLNPQADTKIKLSDSETTFPFNKAVLAFHSKFFNSIFFGPEKYKESDQNEMVLKDVGSAPFVNLINFLFVRSFKLKMVHVTGVLELADRFGIAAIVNECEELLVECERGCSEPSLAERLALATKYKLQKLRKRCLQLCDSPKVIKEVTASPFYKQLSADVAKMLLDRLVVVLP